MSLQMRQLERIFQSKVFRRKGQSSAKHFIITNIPVKIIPNRKDIPVRNIQSVGTLHYKRISENVCSSTKVFRRKGHSSTKNSVSTNILVQNIQLSRIFQSKLFRRQEYLIRKSKLERIFQYESIPTGRLFRTGIRSISLQNSDSSENIPVKIIQTARIFNTKE